MTNRRSQAALEFIMTYGWAILVVLVAIGALAYFGVLSPDKFLPAKCTLQSGIACVDHKATATSLTISVRNSLGYDVTVDSVKAQQCTASAPATTLTNGATDPTNFILTCVNGGSKYNGNVNISYTNADTQVTHVNQGQITTRIE